MALQTADLDRTQLIARIEGGLPTLTPLGVAAFIPFMAKRLRNPSLVWTNHRWFMKRGVDIASPEARTEVETWLLDSFAFAIPLARDPEEAFADEWRTFHADRGGVDIKSR